MKALMLATSLVIVLATQARADQAAVSHLNSAVSVCNKTLATAQSGEYSSYPTFRMDPILSDITDLVKKARATSESATANAVIDPVLVRLGKILANDSVHHTNSYSIPTVVTLFRGLESALSKAEADEKAGSASK